MPITVLVLGAYTVLMRTTNENSFNLTLSLVLWKFHIMHSDSIHFSVLPGPPTHYYDPPPPTREEEIPSPIYVVLILTGAWGNSQWPLLEKTESFPTHTPAGALRCESYTSASLSQVSRVLLDGFLSRLLLFRAGGSGG